MFEVFLGGICFDLVLESLVGGPIYRTEASTKGLAAINGCHEFIGRVRFRRSTPFDLFRSKLLRKRSLSSFKVLEKNTLMVPIVIRILGI